LLSFSLTAAQKGNPAASGVAAGAGREGHFFSRMNDIAGFEVKKAIDKSV
jgi:hypothetical protein